MSSGAENRTGGKFKFRAVTAAKGRAKDKGVETRKGDG